MAISGISGSNDPFIIIIGSNSLHGFAVPEKSTMRFGTVKVVYASCGKFGVGDSVFFDTSKAQVFSGGGTGYYVINQQYILFTES